MGLSKLGTRLIFDLLCYMHPPCDQRLGDNPPCHDDAGWGFGNIMPSCALFAELNVVCSYTGQFTSQAEPCGYTLFLCSGFHKITIVQAGLQLDLCTVLCSDSCPIKWG